MITMKTGTGETYSFLVTWPQDTEPPMNCGRSYRVWFGTESAMVEATGIYRAEGALVLSYQFGGEPVSMCQHHGIVELEHACRAPGETVGQFTARMFGEVRDV